VWVLIGVCLVVSAVFIPESLAATRRDAVASLLYVQNWNLILESQSYFGAIGRPPLLQHLWTLSIEEQFYLVWPLIMLAVLPRLRQRGLLAVSLIGAVASTWLMWSLYSPDGDPSRVYFGTLTRAAPLLLGAALAVVWPAGRLRSRIDRGAALMLDAIGGLALLALLVVIATVNDYDPWLYRGGLTVIALVTAVLIAVTVHPGAHLGRVADRWPLRWLGRRSYGIYLWHWPVIVMSRPHIDVPISGWPLVALQASATLGLAAASYRFIEQPIRRNGFSWLRDRVRLQRPGRRAATGLAGVAAILVLTWAAMLATARTSLAAHVHATGAAQQAPAPIVTKPRTVAAKRSSHRKHHSSATSQRPGGVLAIGDSVMLAAASALEHRLGSRVRVDAAVGRQISDIADRLDAYRRAGAMPPNVVLQIGDNGPVWYADLMRLKQALRGVPDVIFVNVRVPRSWQDEANNAVAQFVHRWRHAHIADWYSVSGAPGLLWDGLHPDAQGRALYAGVVAKALQVHGATG
jgi:peptidoglycan/LPS O-acetylase OafA/YrhL